MVRWVVRVFLFLYPSNNVSATNTAHVRKPDRIQQMDLSGFLLTLKTLERLQATSLQRVPETLRSQAHHNTPLAIGCIPQVKSKRLTPPQPSTNMLPDTGRVRKQHGLPRHASPLPEAARTSDPRVGRIGFFTLPIRQKYTRANTRLNK